MSFNFFSDGMDGYGWLQKHFKTVLDESTTGLFIGTQEMKWMVALTGVSPESPLTRQVTSNTVSVLSCSKSVAVAYSHPGRWGPPTL